MKYCHHFFALVVYIENSFSYFIDRICLYSEHRHKKGKEGWGKHLNFFQISVYMLVGSLQGELHF